MNPADPQNTDMNLDEVVVAYLEAVEGGQSPDRQEWLARYPQLALQLSEFFADQDRFGRLAGSLREAVAPVPESAVEEKLSEGGRLGDFRILRQVGRGGMGIVFEAEQISLGRRVALKVLPFVSTLDAKQLQRFKNEAQAAAQLHHTSIVPVYATGCERGVHYYAMQFIEGQTLAALIRELRQLAGVGKQGSRIGDRRLNAQGSLLDSLQTAPYAPEDKSPEKNEDRKAEPKEIASTIHQTSGAETPRAHARSSILDSRPSQFFRTVANLGIQAAEALEHAHQLGVIHRDIKPANLLVDVRGNLWITDFGLAHCQGQAGLTMTGDLIGTLRYMSPEQALAKRVLVDHRTDIYSLGATLYELLTLEPAFCGSDRQELLRQIAFEEPRPLRRVNKSVPPELETIVLKSMEKGPQERYATAQELADDLRRFLQHEPIQAKKPTWIQRAGKWSRRHPAIVRSAILVVFLITAGSLLSTWLIWQEKKQTVIERNRAEEEKRIAQAVRDFLQKKLLIQADTLQQANALLFAGRASADAKWNPTIGELLDRAAAELAPDKIEAQFPNQPLVQAEILQTLGDTYQGIGQYEQAIAHLERARDLRQRELGPDHSELLNSNNLAVAYAYAGRLPDAIRLLEQVWDMQTQKFGLDHAETLITQGNLAMAYQATGRLPEAIRLLEQVRDKQIQKLGPDHPEILNTLNNLATAYQAVGRLPEAIGLYEQVRDKQIQKFGPDQPKTLRTLNNLAMAYEAAGRLAEAIPLLETVRDMLFQKLGPDHPETLNTLGNLGMAYQAAGRLPEAIPLLKQVLDMRFQKLGPDHPETLTTLSNLAAAYFGAGKLPDAIRLFEQVRDKQIQKLGPDHPETLNTLNNLAAAYRAGQRVPEAIRLLEEVRDKQIQKLGPDHPKTLSTKDNLATAYQAAGRLPEAIALYEQVRDKRIQKLGTDHPDTLTTLNNLAAAYFGAGKLPEAIGLFEQVRDKRIKTSGLDHPETMNTLNNLAVAYLNSSRLPEAIRLLEQLRAKRTEKSGPDHPETMNTLNNLASAYWKAQRFPEAIRLFEELLEKHKAKLGVNHPNTLVTMANLAVIYRDAARPAQAVPLLEEAMGRVRKLPDPKPANVTWIPGAMAETYDQAGQFAKAEPLYREFVTQARQQSGADHPETAKMLAFLGLNLLRQNKSADAEGVLRECLAIREKKEPDAWTTFNTMSMLGGALLVQKKYAEAEPLLLQGYEGMKQRETSIPPLGKVHLPEALERLVSLYEANGRKEQAGHWRQELGELKKKGSAVRSQETREKPKTP